MANRSNRPPPYFDRKALRPIATCSNTQALTAFWMTKAMHAPWFLKPY
jgi:hypothetical protein